ncbi:hypothetical protein, partial [Echinicola sediminis]
CSNSQTKEVMVSVKLSISYLFYKNGDLGFILKYAVRKGDTIFLVWVLKVNEELYRRSQGRTIHSLTIFQTSLLITFCYISFILLFTDGYSISSEKDNYAEYGWLIWIYIPFSIFIPVSALYAIYFTSSLINQLERELFTIKEDNSFLLFAALFFFPIGIWWVQPRINRILKTPIEEEKSSY